jgi:hypothetical protein
MIVGGPFVGVGEQRDTMSRTWELERRSMGKERVEVLEYAWEPLQLATMLSFVA